MWWYVSVFCNSPHLAGLSCKVTMTHSDMAGNSKSSTVRYGEIQSGNSLPNPRGISGTETISLDIQECVQVSPFSFSGRIAIWSSRSVRKDGLQSTANTPILVGKTGTCITSRTHPTACTELDGSVMGVVNKQWQCVARCK